ncbi:chorismate lyase [Aliiglaciecola sp. LCG003]|uniref:chorismate--pyruvate lyase family protein n=1 Tax=Aliiglaciecola sp. LCG003 TaxID=3053655 RepID=UPI00257447C2|nr:chorismate lyase [Aliiglaciecola sp. LCG003]WJG09524.1 chorismate lyase [Aliiglaciecola sp. LCG003]
MTHQIQFPVTIPNQWKEIPKVCIPDPHLRNWLLDTGSLTERLQSHCNHFELTIVGQRQMQPELEEMSKLYNLTDEHYGQPWQIREVILWGNGQPWVFARSVLPNALCKADLAELGDKPLGMIIFNDPRFIRQPFQLLQLPEQSTFLQKLNINKVQPLWGRRSVFNFNATQLMVAEVFLPQCPAYAQMVPL